VHRSKRSTIVRQAQDLEFTWFAIGFDEQACILLAQQMKWLVAAVLLAGAALIGVILLVKSDIDFDTFLNYFALGLLIFVLITLAAGFQQNALERVRPGHDAEVAFDTVPGRIFKERRRV
jgi:hypothetical protein